mgnify:CR=1 FL=1
MNRLMIFVILLIIYKINKKSTEMFEGKTHVPMPVVE